ncbi:MAG: hypothetical protein RLZZ501_1493, partial [Pseudomonadota bacterium]
MQVLISNEVEAAFSSGRFVMQTDLLLIDDSLTDLRLLMDMMALRQIRL